MAGKEIEIIVVCVVPFCLNLNQIMLPVAGSGGILKLRDDVQTSAYRDVQGDNAPAIWAFCRGRGGDE